MSKLDRLNARVAKLLTVAVHEVLEVVKETVSEYQEKTARTQRENESLKRKLQELQDQLKTENSAAAPVSHPVSGGRAAVDQQQEHAWSPRLGLEEAEPLQAVKTDLTQEHSLALRLELEHADSQCSFTLAELEPPALLLPEDRALHAEEGASHHTTCGVKSDVDTDSRTFTTPNTQPPAPVSASQLSTQIGLGLTVIKTEPESTDEYTPAAAEPPAILPYDCVDLSCNSTRQDAANAAITQKSQVSTSPYGLVLLHSNHSAVPRKFGFTKNSRAALDVRKHRQQQQLFRRDEPHVCLVCGKTFSRVGNLRIHQRCHTGEKPYGCLQCGRSFRQAGDLKKHKRVHTGEKPYYCSQCGKSFSRGENLKRHQKIHIGETLQLQQVWMEHQTS